MFSTIRRLCSPLAGRRRRATDPIVVLVDTPDAVHASVMFMEKDTSRREEGTNSNNQWNGWPSYLGQWICLRLPSCGPWFDSRACLCYFPKFDNFFQIQYCVGSGKIKFH